MYILAAILLGLSSNLHCLGMCGPLVMAVPMNRNSTASIIWNLIQYHSGRILSYMLLGVLFGTIGSGFQLFGLLQLLSIIFGVAMLFFAWKKWWLQYVEKWVMSIGISKHYNQLFKRLLNSNSAMRLFGLGMLNGFLPCGMVYLALANALLVGSLVGSATAMLFFGIGTMPALFIVGFAAGKISQTTRQKINHITPYLMSIVALLLILRGLNLGIPYVSPKMEIQKTENHEIKTISCCHSSDSCATKE